MAKDLVPLKVKIGLKPNGHAKYPDFNSLAILAGDDWSEYIDREGTGWHYDCCGHKEEDVDSPRGMQWGMLLVPKAFADQAIAAFPNECEKLTEVECEAFYNDKHAKDMDDEEIDLSVVEAIKRKQDLGVPLTARQLDAIDPTTDTRGIRKNKDKAWSDFKVKRGLRIIQ